MGFIQNCMLIGFIHHRKIANKYTQIPIFQASKIASQTSIYRRLPQTSNLWAIDQPASITQNTPPPSWQTLTVDGAALKNDRGNQSWLFSHSGFLKAVCSWLSNHGCLRRLVGCFDCGDLGGNTRGFCAIVALSLPRIKVGHQSL